jgi:hypothetical protein
VDRPSELVRQLQRLRRAGEVAGQQVVEADVELDGREVGGNVGGADRAGRDDHLVQPVAVGEGPVEQPAPAQRPDHDQSGVENVCGLVAGAEIGELGRAGGQRRDGEQQVVALPRPARCQELSCDG